MSLHKDIIRLTIMPHPFKSTRIVKEMERDSYINLFRNGFDSKYPITNAVIIDKDERIDSNNYSNMPRTDEVIIKIVPTAGGNSSELKQKGTGAKILGTVVASIGAVLIAASSPAWLTAAVIGTGVSMIIGGAVMYNWEIPEAEEVVEKQPSIRGGKNQIRYGERVPVLFGKHLIVPDSCVVPYTTVANDKQYLHQIFCLGYNDMVVDTNSYKLGDNTLTTFTDYNVELRQDATPFVYYADRVMENVAGVYMKKGNHNQAIPIKSTSGNCNKVEVTILFPKGLYDVLDTGRNVDDHDGVVTFGLDYANYNSETYKYHSYGIIRNRTRSPFRITRTIEFDNNTASDADYNDLRQYKIKFKTWQGSISGSRRTYVNDMYIESIKSYTGVFDGAGNPITEPIKSSIQAELTTLGLRVKATEQLNGVIDNFNCIAQTNVLNYVGTGSGVVQWTKALTSNPASMFLYAISSPHITKKYMDLTDPIQVAKIDWDSLESWHTFCATKDFECNIHTKESLTLQETLNRICATGRASWHLLDGKYTIIIDSEKVNVVQYVTPRNSFDFSGSKAFNNQPSMLNMNFINKDANYMQDTRKVYFNDITPDESSPQEVTLWGVTDTEQAWKIGKYMLACTELRPEAFSFSMDIEHIVATRGSRIKLTHDVPLLGLNSGRVSDILMSGGTTIGFVSDELIVYEVGKAYSCIFRKSDGSSITKTVVNPAIAEITESQTVLFITAIPDIVTISSDDLFMFGETGKESLDLIITGIEPRSDLSATLNCVPYSPDIFLADSGTIPAYTSQINLPPDEYELLGDLTDLPDPNQAIIDNATVIIDTDVSNIALTVKRPASFVVTTARGIYPTAAGTDNLVYVNYDNMRMYLKEKIVVSNGTSLGTMTAIMPVVDGDDLVYVNISRGGKLYKKSLSNTLEGTALTTVKGTRPSILLSLAEDGITEIKEIYYINYDDNNTVYKTTLTGGDGIKVLDESVQELAIVGATLVYLQGGKGYFTSVSSPTTGTLFLDVLAQEMTALTTSDVIYVRDNIIYEKKIDETDTSEGTPLFVGGISIGSKDGTVFYSNYLNNYNINVNLSEEEATIVQPVMEGAENNYTIKANITNNSDILTDVSAEDLSYLAINDFLIADGIPDKTRVKIKGTTFVYMTNAATATHLDSDITVSGIRIYLNANKVVVPGTIEAKLLSASAINSKAKAIDGNYITDIDLDGGKYKFRKKDGTVVLDFDPERTDSELQITGTMQSGNFVTGSTGWKIDQNGNAEFQNATLRGNIRTGAYNGIEFLDLLSKFAYFNWFPHDITNSNRMLDIAFNGVMYLFDERYISCGYGGLVYFSDYGHTWTAATPGTSADLFACAVIKMESYNPGAILSIVAGAGGTIKHYFGSGLGWGTATSGTTERLRSIGQKDGLFTTDVLIIVGENGTILRSTDLASWTSIIVPGASGKILRSAKYVNGKFFICGDDITLVSIDDGLTWNSIPIPSGNSTKDVTYNEFMEEYIFGGTDMYVTKDLITFQTYPVDGNIDSLAYLNGAVVGIQSGFANILYSIDNITWTEKKNAFFSPVYKIIKGDDSLVSIGIADIPLSGRVHTSLKL